MRVRTLCVADAGSRQVLEALLPLFPHCEVLAWVTPSALEAAIAEARPAVVLATASAFLVPPPAVAHEPSIPYGADMVALPVCDGIEVRSAADITAVVGDGGYTKVTMVRGNDLLLARSLAECEPLLSGHGFMRIHRSTIVNLRYVRRLLRGRTARVVLANGREYDVSATYREALFRLLLPAGRAATS